MKVSLIQMNSMHDKPKNLAEAKRLVDKAVKEEHPDWVLLPECFDFLGGSVADKLAIAEEVPGGPAYKLCQDLAKTHKVFVHAGSIAEKVPGENKVHNTTLVFDRDGKEVARYRKIHLFDVTSPDGTEYKESAAVTPGDAVVTYDCDGVTVGCAICYDLRFPDLFQALADKGAQVIALPAAFTQQTGKDHWEVLLRARAIENHCFVLAAAQGGQHENGRRTWGHSMAINAWGEVLGQRTQAGAGVVLATLEPAHLQQVRQQLPALEHRTLS